MNGIEAAFVARLGVEPEFRIRAAGKPWSRFSACIGNDDEAHQDPPDKSGQKYLSLTFREAQHHAAAKPKSAAWVVVTIRSNSEVMGP
jgi:hypothetical protein